MSLAARNEVSAPLRRTGCSSGVHPNRQNRLLSMMVR